MTSKRRSALRRARTSQLALASLLTFGVALPSALAQSTPSSAPATQPVKEPLRSHLSRWPFLSKIPITFSGYFWVDGGYMQRTNAKAGQFDQGSAYMQGRFVLAAEHYQEWGSLYTKARAEVIAFVNEYTKSQFEPHILDAYVELGQSWWDIRAGRFLGWESYHRGAGIELFTAEEAGALGGPALYWLQLARGYKDEAGQIAVHLYPWKHLSIEVAGVYGQESNQNNYGVRPVVAFNYGGFTALGGYEFLTQQPQTEADKTKTTTHGFTGQLRYKLSIVTAGANFGRATRDAIDIQGLVDSEKTFDEWISVGGFVNLDFWRNAIGLGYHYTYQKNRQGEQNSHQQAFVSYLFRLPIKGLALKAVYGFARAHIQDVDVNDEWNNTMHTARLRIVYDPSHLMDLLVYSPGKR